MSGRQRIGELVLPAELTGSLVAVLGLDDRPQASARYRTARADVASVSYTPVELAAVYNMPDGDGSGQTIAIIELGGGFGQGDLDTYFAGLQRSSPKVTAVGVDGATNVPCKDPNGADGEVLLDIEVAGGIAPGARQFVYFAPNTDDGFLDAVTQAAHADPAPTAMSISWGQSEDQWSEQARTAMDGAFADAALLGVSVGGGRRQRQRRRPGRPSSRRRWARRAAYRLPGLEPTRPGLGRDGVAPRCERRGRGRNGLERRRARRLDRRGRQRRVRRARLAGEGRRPGPGRHQQLRESRPWRP